MDESLDLDHLGSPPLPPPKLYKYLSPERVENVLEARTFRFSFLMSTNDPFEVRATFRKLIGPKFASLLESQLTDTFIDESIDQLIHEELDDNHPKGYDWLFGILDFRQALWVVVAIAGIAAAPTIVAAIWTT